jgi:hypothetical protein
MSDSPFDPKSVQVPSTSPIHNTNPEQSKKQAQSFRAKFARSLTSLFGFRKTSKRRSIGKNSDLQFVKVDADSEMKIAQAKIGKVFTTKLSSRLEELFNAWLIDTTDTYQNFENRLKRLAELEFAVTNDPFLSMAAELYADEATQLDVQDQLILVDCADPRMKQKMENLVEQWGITQNRVRSAMYNMAWSGDSFWSNKVTPRGVQRINPLDVHQITERLEFDPVQVSAQLALNHDLVTALSRDAKLQLLFDRLESEDHDEYADMFDKKLFGFVADGNLVLPPWNVTHFRLNSEQSEFYPMGRSFFLKALAPFRQCNATMTLQSIARVMSFPITVYSIKTPPGMDEAQQFEKINEAREQYDNIGETGNSSEALSVNTRIWVPEGLMTLEVHSPNIDLSAIGDIQMYQDRVAIATGIPKGYLVQEWGGFGNSAISLVEQWKPFARRVFTLQSAFLEGLSNLFRLHFAITNEFDYREPFVLSMKFPGDEMSDARVAAKEKSIQLSKDVIDIISNLIGAINNPLPAEVLQDILSKFSFLDPDDIKKWMKVRASSTANKKGAKPDDTFGGGGGGLGGGMSGGEAPTGGGGDLSGAFGADTGTPPTGGEGVSGGALPTGGAGNIDLGDSLDNAQMPSSGPMPTTPNAEQNKEKQPLPNEQENYDSFVRNRLTEKRINELNRRYTKLKEGIYREVINVWKKIEEGTVNKRHYKYTAIQSYMENVYDVLSKPVAKNKPKTLKETVDSMMNKYNPDLKKYSAQNENKGKKEEKKLNWQDLKDGITEDSIDDDYYYPQEGNQPEAEEEPQELSPQQKIKNIL